MCYVPVRGGVRGVQGQQYVPPYRYLFPENGIKVPFSRENSRIWPNCTPFLGDAPQSPLTERARTATGTVPCS